MRIKLVCVLVFLLSMGGSLFAEPQGGESPPYAPPSVRYWSNEQDSTLTAQPMIPLRSEPKLLVLLYHNVVFGRTGNVYNRDLYNFENDLLFVKRNFTLTNFKQLLTNQ